MNSNSPTNINSVNHRRRIPSSNEPDVQPRYYLHHHRPNHPGPNRTLSLIRQRMSFSSLNQLMRSTNSPVQTASPKSTQMSDKARAYARSSAGGMKSSNRRGSMSTGHLANIQKESEAQPRVSEPNVTAIRSRSGAGGSDSERVANVVSSSRGVVHTIRGHAFVPATCTRLRLPCETCQQTVHKHRYLYCRHCPVVSHARDACISGVPRPCPSLELAIEGWGEGQHPVKIVDQSKLNLEDVFLCGMLGLQANKCYECACTLNPNIGREFIPEGDKRGVQQKETGIEAKSIADVKISPFKLAREPLRRLNSPNHHHAGANRVRICHLTGKYFCERCHWNDQWYIPGSIFLLNDTSLYPLSRSAYLKLRVLWDSAIFRIPVYWHRENALAYQVFQVRSKLHQLLRYTLYCPMASALKDYSELTEPTHLLGYPHYLRMCDVIQILSASLYQKMQNHLESWSNHLSHCETCQERPQRNQFRGPISMKISNAE